MPSLSLEGVDATSPVRAFLRTAVMAEEEEVPPLSGVDTSAFLKCQE